MLSSSEYSGVKPEKCTFSQTCSLLSQYLKVKEKGTFGDLTLGITCTVETNGSPETSCHSATTMDLFPTKENNMAPPNLTTMDFLSPHAASASYGRHSTEEVPTLVNSISSAFKSVTVSKEPKTAQLTVFYGGQVIVYDDFPSDKVEEIMSFARNGISQTQNPSPYANTNNQTRPSVIPNIIIPGNLIQDHPHAPIVCDLPIARKASLHRFLEKRKDRIAARAPYQTSYPTATDYEAAESMAWLKLAARSTLLSAASFK